MGGRRPDPASCAAVGIRVPVGGMDAAGSMLGASGAAPEGTGCTEVDRTPDSCSLGASLLLRLGGERRANHAPRPTRSAARAIAARPMDRGDRRGGFVRATLDPDSVDAPWK